MVSHCYRDRTTEFFAILQSKEEEQQQLAKPTPPTSYSSFSSLSKRSTQQQSQFTQAAQHIDHSIYEVTQKLERLSKLAKQRSLFNDPVHEINELSYVIKTSLQTIHHELEILHDWVTHSEETKNTSSSSRHGTFANNTIIVNNLKQKITTTTYSFQDILQVRAQNLKEQNTRRKQFESNNTVVRLRKRAVNPFENLIDINALTYNNNEPMLLPDGDNDDVVQSLALADTQQSYQQDDYFLSRAQAIEQIESTIEEVVQLYKKLVTIVNIQEETTITIDSNMDETLEHVDRGHKELLTYFDRMSSNHMLLLKIFIVVLFFLVFFMLFIA